MKALVSTQRQLYKKLGMAARIGQFPLSLNGLMAEWDGDAEVHAAMQGCGTLMETDLR
jgi:hypothetical protein